MPTEIQYSLFNIQYLFPKPILIIGLGNTVRSDDGIGIQACEAIDRLHWTGVATTTSAQLFPEMALEMDGYATVIIIDASVEVGDVALRKIEPGDSGSVSLSHHMDPGGLVALQQLIGSRSADVYLCAIPGVEFGHGERLSPTALLNLQKAIALISTRIH